MSRLAYIGFVIAGLFILAAIFAPFIATLAMLAAALAAPACGLALHPAPDALRITAEVKQAQARLRALL